MKKEGTGILITGGYRGRKRKDVHFRDEEMGKDINDVYIIESYKKYYIESDASCSCACTIF